MPQMQLGWYVQVSRRFFSDKVLERGVRPRPSRLRLPPPHNTQPPQPQDGISPWVKIQKKSPFFVVSFFGYYYKNVEKYIFGTKKYAIFGLAKILTIVFCFPRFRSLCRIFLLAHFALWHQGKKGLTGARRRHSSTFMHHSTIYINGGWRLKWYSNNSTTVFETRRQARRFNSLSMHNYLENILY